MDKSKFLGTVGVTIGGGIMAPIIWLYRLKKKWNVYLGDWRYFGYFDVEIS